MKAKTILFAVALVLLSAGRAQAEGPIAVDEAFVSYRTPQEVRAELVAYKKSGVNPWSMSYNPLRFFRSTTTRAAVVDGFFAFCEQAQALYGEDSGSAYLSRAQGFGVPWVIAEPQRSVKP